MATQKFTPRRIVSRGRGAEKRPNIGGTLLDVTGSTFPVQVRRKDGWGTLRNSKRTEGHGIERGYRNPKNPNAYRSKLRLSVPIVRSSKPVRDVGKCVLRI